MYAYAWMYIPKDICRYLYMYTYVGIKTHTVSPSQSPQFPKTKRFYVQKSTLSLEVSKPGCHPSGRKTSGTSCCGDNCNLLCSYLVMAFSDKQNGTQGGITNPAQTKTGNQDQRDKR